MMKGSVEQMDAAFKTDRYTVSDVYALPEGERAELIDGEIYYMAPPSRTHQRIVSQLNQKIANYIEEKGGDCEVFPAPFAVFLNENNSNYLEPDISVICDLEKLDEKGCHGAPDWVIEIVSPGSRFRDYCKKLLKYASGGVREYWIVDPVKQCVTVYNFEQETMEEYAFGKAVPSGIFEDLCVTL